MIKRNYLAIVDNSFNSENQEFKNSLKDMNLNLERHFPKIGIIKLSVLSEDNVTIELSANDLPFVEYIEEEESVHIPPDEIEET